MSDPPSKYVWADCSCGARLKLPASAEGRKARCPKCEAVFSVSTPDPYAVAECSSSQDLNGQETIPIRVEPSHQESADDSFEYELPRQATAPAYFAEEREQHPWIAWLGEWPRGLILCCVGTAIGMCIWVGFGCMGDFESLGLAMILGSLAGGGWYLGLGRGSAVAGLIAACIALMGFFVAKMMVFEHFDGAARAFCPELVDSTTADKYEIALSRAFTVARRERRVPGRSWQNLVEAEMLLLSSIPEEQLQAEIESFKQWRNHERIEDKQWGRELLIYVYITHTLESDEENIWLIDHLAEKSHQSPRKDFFRDEIEGFIVPTRNDYYFYRGIHLSGKAWENLYDTCEGRVNALTDYQIDAKVAAIIAEYDENLTRWLDHLRTPSSVLASSESFAYFLDTDFDSRDLHHCGVIALCAFGVAIYGRRHPLEE